MATILASILWHVPRYDAMESKIIGPGKIQI